MTLDEIENIKLEWNSFVLKNPNGNIFQTPFMFEVYKNSKNYEPLIIISKDLNNAIDGILLAVVQKEGPFFMELFTRRSIILGGPIVENNNPIILESLLANYIKRVKRKAIFSQFRNMWDNSEQKEIFNKLGFFFIDHLDIINILTIDEEKLWEKLDYSKRKNIKNALKNGLEIKVVNLETKIYEIYNILDEVYKRAKLPLFDITYLKEMHLQLGEKLVCFGAYKDEKLIAVRLVLCYKSLVYDWYAGALEQYLKYRPNDILPWEVMKWAKHSGFKYFDFGGAGKPDVPYGVRDFKLKYGGALKNFGRFEKVHKPILMKIGIIGFKFYKIFYGIRNKFKA